MASIQIQPLRLRHVLPLIRLRRQIEREALHLPIRVGERGESLLYTLARMAASRRRMQTFIAFDGPQMVGYLWMIFGRFQKFRNNAYLAMAGVRPEYRGQGIGTRLFAAAEAHALERKVRRLELEVFSRNTRAVELYRRLGYVEEGRKRQAIQNDDGVDDLIIMAKLFPR